MTNSLFKYFWVIPIFLTFYSCDEILNVEIVGDGNIKTETRNTGSFEEVSLNADFRVFVTNGPASVKVEADSNLLTYIETEVVGNQLQISEKPNFRIIPRQPVRVYLSVDDQLAGLEVTDGGTLIADSLWLPRLALSVYGVSNFIGDTLGCENLTLFSEGSTNIDINGHFGNFLLRQVGSGNVRMEGSSESGNITLEGSGKIDAQNMTLGEAEIVLYGSGLVLCRVPGYLKASIIGGGRIYYYGTPVDLDKEIEGDGLVLPGDD